jgi:hypothetical protein
MATAAEFTFAQAVRTADGVRQVAKAAAFTAYGYVQANLATYLAALESADNAYITAVNSALSTLNVAGITIPNSGTPNPGNVSPGTVGLAAPSALNAIGNGTATMGAIG